MAGHVGIARIGAYVPRARLQRSAIAGAHAWAGQAGSRPGEVAVGAWDEDAITLAVEAARDCAPVEHRHDIARVVLASTSLPFQDRLNAGVVKEALNLPDETGALDVTGSRRAGTSALIQAFQVAQGGGGASLCVASERLRPAPASEGEAWRGDAAAAILVGEAEQPIATLVGASSVTCDLVDEYRATGQAFPYLWESRWVREEGYGRVVPEAIWTALGRVGAKPDEVNRLLVPAPFPGAGRLVGKAAGLANAQTDDPLLDLVGFAGAAHPLLQLANALETAVEGELILCVGFGQGCDVVLVRAGVGALRARGVVSKWIARRREEADYVRYLTTVGLLQPDRGMRAEADQKTPLSALYRNRKTVLGLVGGRCTQTGAIQFPKSDISVAGNARTVGTQEDYPLADRPARITTFTADRLAYTPDPPGCYGMVEFDEGGRLVTEFADVEPENLRVGAAMRMVFRIKAVDEQRGFKRYFWKATPTFAAAASAEDAA